mmetsp:Transcript_56937/g.176624  ORF Transcript_56937/g.176624 Transcript_56937/m.176624 type:complete len:260 (-) Transcript_56937:674-1453(-)
MVAVVGQDIVLLFRELRRQVPPHVVPDLLAELVGVPQGPSLERPAKGRHARLGLEEAAPKPELRAALGPLNHDARMPDASHVLPQEQPGPACRRAVRNVVKPEGDLESLPPEHDVQKVIVTELGVLVKPLAILVSYEHLLCPLLLDDTLGRRHQPLAGPQETLARQGARGALVFANSGLKVHLHAAEDLWVSLQRFTELHVHFLASVEGGAVALQCPIVVPLHHVHCAFQSQVHLRQCCADGGLHKRVHCALSRRPALE